MNYTHLKYFSICTHASANIADDGETCTNVENCLVFVIDGSWQPPLMISGMSKAALSKAK